MDKTLKFLQAQYVTALLSHLKNELILTNQRNQMDIQVMSYKKKLKDDIEECKKVHEKLFFECLDILDDDHGLKLKSFGDGKKDSDKKSS